MDTIPVQFELTMPLTVECFSLEYDLSRFSASTIGINIRLFGCDIELQLYKTPLNKLIGRI